MSLKEKYINRFKDDLQDIYNDYGIDCYSDYDRAVSEIIEDHLPMWDDDINIIFMENINDIENYITIDYNSDLTLQDNIRGIVYSYLYELFCQLIPKYKPEV